jgi:hypothetical protein
MEAATLGSPVYLACNPFDDSIYRAFPINLTHHVADDSFAFMERVTAEGPVRKLPFNRLEGEIKKAVDVIRRIPYDHELIRELSVDASLLNQIKEYRSKLVQSRAMQVRIDGASVSSLFIEAYVLTLTQPYWTHLLFCRLLAAIDCLADGLFALGLFRFCQPLIHYFSRKVFLPDGVYEGVLH